MLLALLVLSLVAVVWWYNKRHFDKWKKLGVPGPAPSNFFGNVFGNMRDATLLKKPISSVYADMYKACPDAPYVGIYIMRRPAILVRDPDILKDILVKDFYSFHDNDLDIDKNLDPIFGNNPFTVKGENWKIIRSQHSPHFTNSKNKTMFPMVEEVGNRLVRYLNQQIEDGGGKYCMEGLEIAAKFTTDNVALCSLGIDGKSFEDGELRREGKKIFNPDFINNLKLFLMFLSPSFARVLAIRLIPKEVHAKYRSLVVENLQYRKENNVVRNDFFDAIKQRKGRDSTVDEMTNQVGGFFIDGFGTSSSAISFMLYELAINTDVQEKVRAEVEEVLSRYDGKYTYEAVQEMSYLDAVVLESLRKYPPLPQLTKLCTKPYTLPPPSPNSKPLEVEVGTPFVIALMGLHYDEKHFPDPYRFNPDRFLNENKENLTKYTHLPFGEGPRICLGMRFAQMQAKVMLAKIIQNFDLRLNPKTKTPIRFDPQGFILTALGGVWIDYYKRKI